MPVWIEQSSEEEVSIGNSLIVMRFSRRHPPPRRTLSPTVFPPPPPRPPLQMTVSVFHANHWQTFFDLPSPLVSGEQFDLWPDDFFIVEHGTDRATLRLTGVQRAVGYQWSAVVQTVADSPLIHVQVTCDLISDLVLNDAQPSSMLWLSLNAKPVMLNQGPGNIYSGPDEKGWGNAFPGAYIWSEGTEAAFFAHMGSLTWMTASRFNRAYRVECSEINSNWGLGLHARETTRNPIPRGQHIVADYSLYAAPRRERPTRSQALDKMIDIFGECHPADSTLPANQIGGPTTWEHFAKSMIGNLLVKDDGGNLGACWDRVTIDPPWSDGLTEPVHQLRISPDYALGSGSWANLVRHRATDLWDFSTCFNYVAPWIGIERLEGNPIWREALDESTRSMPTFFDPEARMIIRQRNHPRFDMPWQLFTFHYEMLKVHDMLDPSLFNPAIGGQFLMSIPALLELAHNEQYVFSQFVEPYKKQGVANQDLPAIGQVREPWQIGSYAWIMARAYEMTGSKQYLDEAEASLDRLLGGEMRFSVKNEYYSINYTEFVDFPITEIFGNGFGIAAGQRLYELTGNQKFFRYSREFLNSLLRVTFWYESALDTDPRDQILNNAGLFPAYHSYAGAAPWETIEAYLPMTAMLRGDSSLVPVPLLMRMFNTMRINSFWFYPPVFHDQAITSRELMESPANYLSIENFYMPERGGDHGGMGRCIYMGQLALWNYLLFEAMAIADDPRIMVLNLDVLVGFHEAVSGAERNWYVFNPTDSNRSFTMCFKSLAAGVYRLTYRNVAGSVEDRPLTSAEFDAGFKLTLPSMSYLRLCLRHADYQQINGQIATTRSAQSRLCHAYQEWRDLQCDHAGDPRIQPCRAQFASAMRSYHDKDYQSAEQKARMLVEELR